MDEKIMVVTKDTFCWDNFLYLTLNINFYFILNANIFTYKYLVININNLYVKEQLFNVKIEVKRVIFNLCYILFLTMKTEIPVDF